ncbi:MAG: portal protein, partial [Geminicoccaceae bacterium]
MPIETGDFRRAATGPLTDEEYQSIITGMVDDAVDFHDDDLSSKREEALNYLRGETDVPHPEPGFSSVVSRVSEDELDGYMTQLMKLFTGAGTPVAFLPSSDNDQELAKQQTDYARYVYSIKNPGYRNTHDTIRSAIGSAAVAGMKVVWSEATEVWQESYTNLGPEELAEFENDPDAEIVEREDVEEDEQIPVQLDDGTEIRETVTRNYHNLTVKWKKPKKGIVIENIPGEELRFDRRATCSDDARIIFQDTRRTRSDLIALGMDDDFIDTHGGGGSGSGEATSQQDQEKRARTNFDQDKDHDRAGGRAMDTYRLMDIWARVDKDGDGIAEWRHCLAIGDHATIWEPSDEMAHDVQIALFIPFLVENTAVGRTLHTKTKDVADTETCLIRGMVDNLSQSNFPKQVAVSGQIENWPHGITNRRSVVNAKRPGVVEYLSVPYLVDGVLKGLEFFKQMTAGRLGVSVAARGLDPENLQSSSDFGVRETFALGSSGHEMVARNLAETGFTKVFR